MAGLKGHVSAEQLQGSMRVAILNLKPAKLAGMASEAMLLAADAPQESGAELVRLLIPPGKYSLLCLDASLHLVGAYALQKPSFQVPALRDAASHTKLLLMCCLLIRELSMNCARCNRHYSEAMFHAAK